ncbi:TetR/AcrR family transcriptional regulator [Catellatospora bangladeshensis]|uniref:TetR/AcrR family transcriptional regulator n=1 Tax=Catellatospora bangladeshensis TaxID=310355 RepID=UPI00361F7917
MEATTTLRERKKEATRQALHEATLRLALERGLDAVTVDAVADEAGVSRRTFSNYFANKEDALLHGDRVRVTRLLERLRARPSPSRHGRR